jgi:hypothetical protein
MISAATELVSATAGINSVTGELKIAFTEMKSADAEPGSWFAEMSSVAGEFNSAFAGWSSGTASLPSAPGERRSEAKFYQIFHKKWLATKPAEVLDSGEMVPSAGSGQSKSGDCGTETNET